jgi:hypothetical protein
MAFRKYKSVSRIDHPSKHMHGWYVRVVFQGDIHSRFFSDRGYRIKRESLAAALKWRDRKEKELGKPRTDRMVPAFSTRNRTGILGLRRTTKAMTRDGSKKGPVYEVTWHPAPKQMRRTTFSITKYGAQEAFRRACEFRRTKELEIYGRELSPFAEQLRKRAPTQSISRTRLRSRSSST